MSNGIEPLFRVGKLRRRGIAALADRASRLMGECQRGELLSLCVDATGEVYIDRVDDACGDEILLTLPAPKVWPDIVPQIREVLDFQLKPAASGRSAARCPSRGPLAARF